MPIAFVDSCGCSVGQVSSPPDLAIVWTGAAETRAWFPPQRLQWRREV